jgi:hypothetical protein
VSLGIQPSVDITAFSSAPLLRTAILNSGSVSNIILPWAQLTLLTLKWVYPNECLSILQKTSNLVHCDLRLPVSPYDPNDIILPYLKSWALEGAQDSFLTNFFDNFTVPALHRLQIWEHSWNIRPSGGPNPIDSLTSLISRSGCKLQELCIMGERAIHNGSYREAFPAIGTISFIDDPEIDRDFFDL